MADRRRRLTVVLLLVAAGLTGVCAAADDEPATAGAPDSPPAVPGPPAAPATQGDMPPSDAKPGEPAAAPAPDSAPNEPGTPPPETAPGEPGAPPPEASPSPPAAAPPPEAPKGVAQPPKNLEPIPKDTAISVLGRKVLGPANENMGRVVDLLLDHDGHLQAVVIDFGGFLGVGSRKIAIDWRLVRFVPDNRDAPIALGLGKADVQAAPEYKDTAQPPVMVGPPPSDPDAAR